jgi:glycosyltransferase involved in cell wall biosynthesis
LSSGERVGPLRVLHIVQTLKGGGAETLVREMIPRLKRRGFKADAICMYNANLTIEDRELLGCEVYELNKKGPFDFAAPLKMVNAIASYNPDVVHAHVVTGKYWGRACAIIAGAPVIVYTEHSPWPTFRLWEWPASFFLNPRTNAIVTFSKRTAQFLWNRERVSGLRIIQNGIEVKPKPCQIDITNARKKLGVADDCIAIGVVANFYPQKNPKLALEAFFEARKRSERAVTLHFFGTGDLEVEMENLAGSMGLDGSVVFHGFRSDIRELLPGLDIFLSVAYSEAAPISFLEAMSAGLPIVSTPSIGALDMVEDDLTGLIAKQWNTRSVSEALTRAIENKQWRVAAGQRARMRLEREFDIEQVVDRYADLYREFAVRPL